MTPSMRVWLGAVVVVMTVVEVGCSSAVPAGGTGGRVGTGGTVGTGGILGNIGTGGTLGTGGDAGVDGGLCPATQPTDGVACTTSTACPYGTQTCCGFTFGYNYCSCSNGHFTCFMNEICHFPPFNPCPVDAAADGTSDPGDARSDRPAGDPSDAATTDAGTDR
jgi:hypothetical protein